MPSIELVVCNLSFDEQSEEKITLILLQKQKQKTFINDK